MRILMVIYDNDSYIHTFPMGSAYIAGALKKDGHDVTIYNQDAYHYSEEHLSHYLDKNHFDMVGLGIIAGYYQYRKLLALSKAINESKQRPFFVLGGHGPSPEPEFFLKKTNADAVVMGEGELTIKELSKAVSEKKSFENIQGLAYRDGNQVKVNPRRGVIEDLDSIDFPAYELFPIDYYKLIRMPRIQKHEFAMSVLTARGCIFNCKFCYRIDPGYRPRSIEGIKKEILYLKEKYNINYFIFHDELLMSSSERAEAISEEIIRSDLNIHWRCEGRLNFARPKALALMKRAGCVFINYGIESLDDLVLKNMNKNLTSKQIIEGIENTFRSGISPGLNIIFGNIGDNKDSLQKGVDFLLKYDDGAQLRTIRPVTPYPGSPLYYYALEKGLLLDCEDFYENKHVNSDLLAVNFTNMSDEDFYKCLWEANTKLLKNYYNKQLKKSLYNAEKLYKEKNVKFRGFRST